MPESKRGRTLFEILTGRNPAKPLELQYHNPLQAKVGCTVAFEHEPDIAGINFVVEGISVYDTKVGSQNFYHTDYQLKGISLDHSAPVRQRLRLIIDDNASGGQRLQLLYLLLVNILIHIHCTIIHLYLLLNCRREPCYYSNYIGLLFRCLAAICVG